MKKDRYSVVIQWSEEDHVYVVTLPEWGGCHTHGATYVEAAKNAQEVLELLIESEEEAGGELPVAHGFMFPGPSGFTYDLNQAAPSIKKDTASNGPIKLLMDDLKSTSNHGQKKTIRAKLRRAGHFGGTRTPPHKISKADARKQFRSTSA